MQFTFGHEFKTTWPAVLGNANLAMSSLSRRSQIHNCEVIPASPMTWNLQERESAKSPKREQDSGRVTRIFTLFLSMFFKADRQQ